MGGRLVLAGSIAQKPFQGGHTWVFLQWLLGFRRLGWEVLLLDRLDAGMAVDAQGRHCAPEASVNLDYLRATLERFGLAEDFSLALRGAAGEEEGRVGLGRRAVMARVAEADLLIDVMGFLDDEEILAVARRRVFLDIDPGFGQIWRASGAADLFAGHDDFVTVGRRLGAPDCAIPDCGLDWIPTAPPVVLAHWPEVAASGGAFTSVGTWRGRYAPLEWQGERYGLRVHSFRALAELPRLSGAEFELALDIDPVETRDLAMLAENGWRLVDPRRVARDPSAYRRYIAGSAAELMVAKDAYVRSRSGWFSDRSVCYLASGRPVVAQDTGLDGELPGGEGLLLFGTLEEAHAAVDAVRREPARHARAARRVAEACFDSDRVLGGLLDRLGAAA
jgi:hypothetical protein